MKTVPFGVAGVAAATGLLLFSSSLRAQDDGAPPAAVSYAIAATIDYGNNLLFQPEKAGTDFGLLGIRPEQSVTVTVQFPAEMAGQPVTAEVLDGGSLTLPEGGLIADENGQVTFSFQSGILGACRINVHLADDANFVRFWVVDLDCPESNPPELPGGY
jgi:hypothetical protein